jgi:hypothetical protein
MAVERRITLQGKERFSGITRECVTRKETASQADARMFARKGRKS